MQGPHQPMKLQQKQEEVIVGQNYPIYCRMLQKMLVQHHGRKGQIQNQLKFFRENWIFCPTFRSHQIPLKPKIYRQANQELINILQTKLRRIEEELSEKDRRQYEDIAQENQRIVMQSKRAKKYSPETE